MPPAQRQNFRGPKSQAAKAKMAAAVDKKQTVLSPMFTLVAKLPSLLPPVKPSLMPCRAYKPHPLGQSKPYPDEAVRLEVNALLHGLIDTVIHITEERDHVIDLECRTWLNALVDAVVCKAGSDIFFSLKSTRKVYASASKRKVLELVADATSTQGISERQAVKQLRFVEGFEKVSGGLLNHWKKHGPNKKRGRKFCVEFEQHVISQLIYTRIEKIEEVNRAVIEANVAHSYHVIVMAAQEVQKWPQFAQLPSVAKLKFSRPWIVGFLGRAALRRRRITAQEKELPPVALIRKRMAEIQAAIMAGDYTLEEILSVDETGIFFGAPPKHQYILESAVRATAPESNEKARFTSLLWGKASGKMGPSWNIIKMDVKGTDLSSSRVLNNLAKKPGFTPAEGWELKVWRRKLTLPMRGKKEPVTSDHVRPYLIHVETFVVITVQINAWMDSAGICMWVDIQLGPYYLKLRKKCIVVWDNCGCHNVAAVAEVFAAWSIQIENLPPKMTDILQVMDLVVNGPVKAGIRRKRIEAIFNYFQSWKIKRLQHAAEKDQTAPPPLFTPPKPT